jgi:UDP-N-acetylmuramoylalanine--D-glutamate ligase
MKIAIAGYGVEGESSYDYWNTPGNDLTIVDERESPTYQLPEGTKTILGDGVFGHLNGFDMIIRTPGLAPSKIKTDGNIWSSTNEFFAHCPATIIGVTGTKGKGTTASLIASILEASGKKVWLVGNIGVPGLSVIDQIGSEDVVVYELSSFQLWDLEKSPHIAVVLLIEADHLDVHSDMEDYVQAKGHIRRFQQDDDICIYHPTNHYSQQIAHLSDAGKILRYGINDDGAVYERDGMFYQNNQVICSTDKLQIVGKHNIENACAAITAARFFDATIDDIENGLSSFHGLPHRLAYVRKVNGVEYYDDSIATTPGSAIAALRAFSAHKVLILGGSDKGADYGPLLKEIIVNGGLRAIVSIGANGTHITAMLDDQSLPLVHRVDSKDMNEIVKVAASLAHAGDIVILSPAAASFDMFKSYADRGEQFVLAVNQL